MPQTTLSDALDPLAEPRTGCRMRTAEGGLVVCDTHGQTVEARLARTQRSRRYDRGSDPADQYIVVEVTLPSTSDDPCRGNLVLGYGPTASPLDKQVLGELG